MATSLLVLSFALPETLENPADLLPAFHGMGAEGQFAALESDGANVDIVEKTARFQAVVNHQSQFKGPAMLFHRFQERIDEELGGLFGGVALFPGQMAADVHHPGHVDIVRATGSTGLAGGTKPKRTALQYRLFLAHLDKPHQLADGPVVGEGVGTTRCTVAALVTGFHVLVAAGFHLRDKIPVGLGKIENLHEFTFGAGFCRVQGQASRSSRPCCVRGQELWLSQKNTDKTGRTVFLRTIFI